MTIRDEAERRPQRPHSDAHPWRRALAGLGHRAQARVLERFQCIAIEREADYLPLIVQRLSKPMEMELDLEGLTA